MIRPSEIQGLIQDLVYARKAATKISDPRIVDEMNIDVGIVYLNSLISIVVKLMTKEMYMEVLKRCNGCQNDDPNQESHQYCLKTNRKSLVNECFETV